MTALRMLAAAAAATLSLATARAATDADQPSFVYPHERAFGAHKAILYAPQIDAWPDFARFEGMMALQFFPDGGE